MLPMILAITNKTCAVSEHQNYAHSNHKGEIHDTRLVIDTKPSLLHAVCSKLLVSIAAI